MRANEKRRALYDAVSAIDPALVQEATAPRHRKVTRIVWRVAACAAVVALLIGAMAGFPLDFGQDEEYVTAPGGLTIRAYALNEDEISEMNSITLEEGVELPWNYGWSSGINVVRGLPIKLDFQNNDFLGADISLDIYVDQGSFYCSKPSPYNHEASDIIGYYYENLGRDFTVPNGTTLYWVDFYSQSGEMASGDLYVDIIVREGNIIVGYAVLKIFEVEHHVFFAQALEIVSYPKVDGAYQNIPRKYVKRQIENAHEMN